MKAKPFVLMFTPVGICLTVYILAADFTLMEKNMLILLWLTYRYKYVWDAEENIKLSYKQMIIYIALLVLEQIISSAAVPIASMLSKSTYAEVDFTIKSQEHLFLNGVVIGPIVEEWLFRGVGLKMANNFFNNIHAAIIIQAMLFGMMHFNWYQFLGAIPMGIITGYLYYKYKSLKLCIAFHAAGNMYAFTAPLFRCLCF